VTGYDSSFQGALSSLLDQTMEFDDGPDVTQNDNRSVSNLSRASLEPIKPPQSKKRKRSTEPPQKQQQQQQQKVKSTSLQIPLSDYPKKKYPKYLDRNHYFGGRNRRNEPKSNPISNGYPPSRFYKGDNSRRPLVSKERMGYPRVFSREAFYESTENNYRPAIRNRFVPKKVKDDPFDPMADRKNHARPPRSDYKPTSNAESAFSSKPKTSHQRQSLRINPKSILNHTDSSMALMEYIFKDVNVYNSFPRNRKSFYNKYYNDHPSHRILVLSNGSFKIYIKLGKRLVDNLTIRDPLVNLYQDVQGDFKPKPLASNRFSYVCTNVISDPLTIEEFKEPIGHAYFETQSSLIKAAE